MKIMLDAKDLHERVAGMLADEGIAVEEMTWGWEDEAPTLEIIIGSLPVDTKPLRLQVAELRDKVAKLEEQAAAILTRPAVYGPGVWSPDTGAVTAPPMTVTVTNSQESPKRPEETETPSPPKSTDPDVIRREALKETMKQNEALIGHPLGSNMKKGQRPLASNESFDFPR